MRRLLTEVESAVYEPENLSAELLVDTIITIKEGDVTAGGQMDELDVISAKVPVLLRSLLEKEQT